MDLLNIYLDEIKDVIDYPEEWFLDYVKELLTTDDLYLVLKKIQSDKYTFDDFRNCCNLDNKPFFEACGTLLAVLNHDTDIASSVSIALAKNGEKKYDKIIDNYANDVLDVECANSFLMVLERLYTVYNQTN